MIRTLYWEGDTVMILDQRRLPGEAPYLRCRDMGRVIRCIQTLATRGAPAIGVAAAMGLALAARAIRAKDPAKFRERFRQRAEVMRAARPTAVNLGWAVDRVLAVVEGGPDDAEELKSLVRHESRVMLEEDIATNRAIGRHGAEVVPHGATVITHCNAGSLATAGFGTALGVIYAAKEAGKKVSVIADETRPLLQGARISAWEMVAEGIPVQVAVDGASAAILSKGLAQVAVVGADRIAMNGDVANKIGTCNLALAAARYGVPFYVAAPLSTVDPAAATGEDIPIEERDPAEVLRLGGRRLAPEGAGALNFAFDVTPHDLVAGIITEAGVLRPPYSQSLAAAKRGGQL
jgi:methylthioribose-1-phosphate isomerase